MLQVVTMKNGITIFISIIFLLFIFSLFYSVPVLHKKVTLTFINFEALSICECVTQLKSEKNKPRLNCADKCNTIKGKMKIQHLPDRKPELSNHNIQ